MYIIFTIAFYSKLSYVSYENNESTESIWTFTGKNKFRIYNKVYTMYCSDNNNLIVYSSHNNPIHYKQGNCRKYKLIGDNNISICCVNIMRNIKQLPSNYENVLYNNIALLLLPFIYLCFVSIICMHLELKIIIKKLFDNILIV